MSANNNKIDHTPNTIFSLIYRVIKFDAWKASPNQPPFDQLTQNRLDPGGKQRYRIDFEQEKKSNLFEGIPLESLLALTQQIKDCQLPQVFSVKIRRYQDSSEIWQLILNHLGFYTCESRINWKNPCDSWKPGDEPHQSSACEAVTRPISLAIRFSLFPFHLSVSQKKKRNAINVYTTLYQEVETPFSRSLSAYNQRNKLPGFGKDGWPCQQRQCTHDVRYDEHGKDWYSYFHDRSPTFFSQYALPFDEIERW
mmetsp:Transcript_13061/g.19735  ORF Transcript_13061/g.19735 Transcript_13061/m.19735 type:complete len:253 (+) Transcript_13061:6-764(+)